MYEKFIARQPIFDLMLNVFAYELLFRAGSRNALEFPTEVYDATVIDSVTLFELQALTGPVKAFVNVDEAALRREAPRLLPPDRVILEILETVVPSPDIVEICKGLCASGYVIALDDFVEHEKWEPLVALAHFIKVDFQATRGAMRRGLVERFAGRGLQLLAEKVESHEEVQEARALGYTLFQGFFFCKPAMVAMRDIPDNKLNCVRLLEAVSAPGFSRKGIEYLLGQDPSMVYKLLRYLNSPILGLRNEVRGISHAISLLGEAEFRRWISILAIVGMASDKPPELVRTALTRGYFCEELSRSTGMTMHSADLFLLGLLSVTDAILDRPIEHILASLPVSPEVRSALCGETNSFRDVYDTLLAYERADWHALATAASRVGPIEAAVPDCYQAARARAGALTS